MHRLTAVLFYVLVVGNYGGSLAVPTKGASRGSKSEDLESRCTGHCFSKMRSVMDYVAANQQRWNTCQKIAEDVGRADQSQIIIQLASLQEDVTKIRASQESQDVKLDRQQIAMQESLQKATPQDLEGKLGSMQTQLAALQNELASMQININSHHLVSKETQTAQTSLQEVVNSIRNSLESNFIKLERQQESMRTVIPQDFERKLSRTEAHLSNLENKLQAMQSKLDNHLAAIRETLTKVKTEFIPPGFKQIGSRYFHIQEDIKLNWADAQDTCRRMGGHLASIQNREEFDAIVAKLDNSEKYFLGINDRAKKGDLVSVASGRPASFFKWFPSEPEYNNDQERCIAIKGGFMFVNNCTYRKRFICQTDDKI
ncbi:accessory gland protein Acp29AB [Drosophila biarmipes]|uniref:accessory gland protein Acp29AB n=1 Tax=Drosophila biarmipes TaxID=125945 RepID=UPI0007E7A2B3|nr:accessory gland protein Acp29AB [Drosophila biarmipes]